VFLKLVGDVLLERMCGTPAGAAAAMEALMGMSLQYLAGVLVALEPMHAEVSTGC
jgi:hypothetical protein